MSYILDALRKAEAERARGAVPGVHAQQGPDDSGGGGGRQAVKLLTAAVVVLVVALAGVVGWQWMDRRPEVATAPLRNETLAQAPESLRADNAARRVEPAGPTTASAPSTSTSTAPALAPAAPAATESTASVSTPPQGLEQPRALPVRPATEAPAAAPAPATPTITTTTAAPRHSTQGALPGSGASQPAATSTASRTAVATPTPTPTPSPAMPPIYQPLPPQAAQQPTQPQQQQQRTYAVNELPDSIRSSLPNYSINGASYSENPAARLLIVNGQIAHEGDMLPGGAVLEQIKLKSVVLRWKGYHVEMTY